MIKAIRGMRDILPPETSRWQWVESVAREVFDLYGYQEIRLPLLERTELFARSIGADTDIVIRFYSKDTADGDAGRGSLSLLVPGNLSLHYYDQEGRRLLKKIVNVQP